jgi:hypothetical protein
VIRSIFCFLVFFVLRSVDEVRKEIATRMTQRLQRVQTPTTTSSASSGAGGGVRRVGSAFSNSQQQQQQHHAGTPTSSEINGVDSVNPTLVGLKDFTAADRERFIQLLLANHHVLDLLQERAVTRLPQGSSLAPQRPGTSGSSFS